MLKQISILGLFFAALRLGADPVTVTVVGDRVNLRNAPTVESDVITAAEYGDQLQARQFQEGWVEVVPPKSIAVWVYSPLLFEDTEVKAPVLNTRAGPGTNFPVLGQLKRGDGVTVLESSGDWRRIEVPEPVTLWISRKFIQAPPSVVTTKPTPTPEPENRVEPDRPAPIPTPEVIVEVHTVERIVEVPVRPTPTPTVKPPPGLDLVPLGGQGTYSVRKGWVKGYLFAGNSPSRFQLIRLNRQGEEEALAYLRGDVEDLTAMDGRPVLIRGRDFWVTGKKLPVTDVQSMEHLEETE